jgi:hypothetical protein
MGMTNESIFETFEAEIRVIFNFWQECTAVLKETWKFF